MIHTLSDGPNRQSHLRSWIIRRLGSSWNQSESKEPSGPTVPNGVGGEMDDVKDMEWVSLVPFSNCTLIFMRPILRNQ